MDEGLFFFVLCISAGGGFLDFFFVGDPFTDSSMVISLPIESDR